MSLRDDVKQYLPELLPNFTKLFEEAERTGRYAVHILGGDSSPNAACDHGRLSVTE